LLILKPRKCGVYFLDKIELLFDLEIAGCKCGENMNFDTIIAFKFFMWYDKINGHLWPQNFSTFTRKNQEK